MIGRLSLPRATDKLKDGGGTMDTIRLMTIVAAVAVLGIVTFYFLTSGDAPMEAPAPAVAPETAPKPVPK